MATAKVSITLERELLEELDRLVAEHAFPSRSRAIQDALAEKLARRRHSRLARECAKLDPAAEQALAEEGLALDLGSWPEY